MVDDPVTERVRKNTQVVSDAAYKGVHPHVVEMDRRPGIIVGKLVPMRTPGLGSICFVSFDSSSDVDDKWESQHLLSMVANPFCY